jgi:hypothetical protein
LVIAFLAVTLIAAAVGGYLFVMTRQAARELGEVITELDRTDPGWRWDELEAKRTSYTAGANSATVIKPVQQQLPASWLNPELEFTQEPPVALSASQIKDLAAELGRVRPALTQARRLKDFPHGRGPSAGPIAGAPGWLDHVEGVRSITNLLTHDALLRSEQNDVDGAVQSCQAALNAARSIGDEPNLTALLIRVSCRMLAFHYLERVLAQGQPSDTALAELQALTEDEEAQPLSLVAARGERAYCDNVMWDLKTGKLKPCVLTGSVPLKGWTLGPIDPELLLSPILIGPLDANHAAVLEYLTEFVAIAKLPPEEQKPRLRALEAGLPSQPAWIPPLALSISKTLESLLRSRAEMRCALAMLAVERHRLKHRRWPDTLEALVAEKLLARVPADPYDGAPLRYVRIADGVVIYSIGPDGKDDGGKIDRPKPQAPGTDLGYQLWDVAKRRQPGVK